MKELQIKQVIQELDLLEKPYAIVYNPGVVGLENRVKSKWNDGKHLFMPSTSADYNKLYFIDRKSAENNDVYILELQGKWNLDTGRIIPLEMEEMSEIGEGLFKEVESKEYCVGWNKTPCMPIEQAFIDGENDNKKPEYPWYHPKDMHSDVVDKFGIV